MRLPFNIRLLMAAWNLLFLKTSGSSPTRQRAGREPGRLSRARADPLRHLPHAPQPAGGRGGLARGGCGGSRHRACAEHYRRSQKWSAAGARAGACRLSAARARPQQGAGGRADTRPVFAQGQPAGDLSTVRGRDRAGRKRARCPARSFTMPIAQRCHGTSGQGSADGSSPSLFHNTGAEGDLWRERERVLGRTAWKPSRSSCSCCSR